MSRSVAALWRNFVHGRDAGAKLGNVGAMYMGYRGHSTPHHSLVLGYGPTVEGMFVEYRRCSQRSAVNVPCTSHSFGRHVVCLTYYTTQISAHHLRNVIVKAID